MSSFASYFRERGKLITNYFASIEEAQRNRYIEHKSAVLIQSHWRGLAVRKNMKRLNNAAVIIQKRWRQYSNELKYRCLKVQKETDERTNFFNLMAAKIQKSWRGFYTRKHIFDFYKQKEFLEKIAEKNIAMSYMLSDYHSKTTEQYALAEEERIASRDVRTALHQHYLISTSAIPSIFQPPAFTRDAQHMPAIEQFIRQVNKAKIVVPSVNRR